jgi:malyl-CoA/(S)-citramalyl-CoA lyase
VRSLLAVPANHARFVAKAAQSTADAVFLDLEDAVVPEHKAEACAAALAAIHGNDWGGRRLGVRVNGLATAWGEQDLVEIARGAPNLAFVILPKCDSVDDVIAADALLRSSKIRIAALIESAKGVASCEAIAAASPRMTALVFGPGDYSLDMGVLDGTMDTTFAQARVANAARAFALDPVDGPYFEIDNPEGCRAACARAISLGFAGKMAIHPTQVDIANTAFSPSEAQVAWAREVLEAMAAAGEQGRGAVKTRDGKMIDLVHIRIARQVLERAHKTTTGGTPR